MNSKRLPKTGQVWYSKDSEVVVIITKVEERSVYKTIQYKERDGPPMVCRCPLETFLEFFELRDQ